MNLKQLISTWRALPGQVNDLNNELAEILEHLERIEAALAQPSNSVYAPVDTETAWIERARARQLRRDPLHGKRPGPTKTPGVLRRR